MLISQLYVCASAVCTVQALIRPVATPGIQGLKDTEQSPHPSLRPQLFPLSPPTFPLPAPTTPAGQPPSSHQLQPIPCSAGSCLCDPEGETESRRSEVALHTATNGTSQKSVDQKPCGDTPTWPLDSVGGGTQRSPPSSLQQWLVQSL